MSDTDRSIEDVARSASRALGSTLEDPCVLRRGRAVVFRAEWRRGSESRPVVVKCFRTEYCGHFTRERAGMETLGTMPELFGFVPRLLGASESAATLLLEDVEPDASHESLLEANDACTVRQTLTDAAHRLGVLHCRARALVPGFHAGDAQLPSPGAALCAGAPRTSSFIGRAFALVGDAHCSRQLETLARSLNTLAVDVDVAGSLTTLTLGDLAPSNVLVKDDRAVFVDLEYCGVRHALYDAMYWHCIYPFPGDVAARMDEAYRNGLGAAASAMSDEEYGEQLCRFLLHRLLWTFSWGMDALFDADRDVVPGISQRALLLAYLAALRRAAGLLPRSADPVTGVLYRLEEALSELWPGARLVRHSER